MFRVIKRLKQFAKNYRLIPCERLSTPAAKFRVRVRRHWIVRIEARVKQVRIRAVLENVHHSPRDATRTPYHIACSTELR